jgi:hypothetical protein
MSVAAVANATARERPLGGQSAASFIQSASGGVMTGTGMGPLAELVAVAKIEPQ